MKSRFYIEITDLGVTVYDRNKGDQPRVCERHWPSMKEEITCECCGQVKKVEYRTDQSAVREAIELCEKLHREASGLQHIAGEINFIT